MRTFALERFLRAERAEVERALERVLQEGGSDGPVAAAARYAVEGGGKRLRPILCVAAYRALRDEVPEPVYRLAASLELIHTYSLVHDDLPCMDDDDVRRGRPSTHRAHGVLHATLAGAALIPRAMAAIGEAATDLALDPGVRTRLTGTLAVAAGAGGMVGGQILDLEAEGRPLTLDALVEVHRKKTGALLGAAPELGAIAAGAEPRVRDAVRRYGRSLGLAFQIADDILDETGSTAVLGKTAGRDRELAKATFPGLAGLEPARARAVEEVETAVAALDAVGVESEELRALAAYAVERDR